MKRIIMHWTGGNYQPNSHEYECYHFLVTGEGLTVEGKFKPEDNLNCYDGKYAAHTGGGNTGSIGVALCGMSGYKNKNVSGNFLLKPAQIEAFFLKVAQLCKKYNIAVTPQTVMTHYEFGKKNPKTSSAGKIDITYLPSYPWVEPNECGNFIRSKIKWYLINKVEQSD